MDDRALAAAQFPTRGVRRGRFTPGQGRDRLTFKDSGGHPAVGT